MGKSDRDGGPGDGRDRTGDRERPIARGVGIDRKTARRYITAVVELGVDRDGGEEQLSDELMARFERVRARRPDGHGEAWRVLLAEEDRIKGWVAEDLMVVKIGILLGRRGVVVPHRTLARFGQRCRSGMLGEIVLCNRQVEHNVEWSARAGRPFDRNRYRSGVGHCDTECRAETGVVAVVVGASGVGRSQGCGSARDREAHGTPRRQTRSGGSDASALRGSAEPSTVRRRALMVWRGVRTARACDQSESHQVRSTSSQRALPPFGPSRGLARTGAAPSHWTGISHPAESAVFKSEMTLPCAATKAERACWSNG